MPEPRRIPINKAEATRRLGLLFESFISLESNLFFEKLWDDEDYAGTAYQLLKMAAAMFSKPELDERTKAEMRVCAMMMESALKYHLESGD
jgi:hypothetical protein